MAEKLEKMHLGQDIISALQDLSAEGVRIIDNADNITSAHPDDGYIRDHAIQIEFTPKIVYRARDNEYWPLRVESILTKMRIHFPEWLRNRIAYQRSLRCLTMEDVAHTISGYPAIGCPVEINDSTSLLYEERIHGIKPIRERVLVYAIPAT